MIAAFKQAFVERRSDLERMKFWREFVRLCDLQDMPALSAQAISRASSEIGVT